MHSMRFGSDSLANRFLPRLWAKYKIDALLVLMAGVPQGSNQWQEWKQEVIRLSLLYGILTPFTSFTDPGTSPIAVAEEPASPTAMPVGFVLLQNYPNPFNPETRIVFYVSPEAARQRVVLEIYDLLGRLVAVLFDREAAPGRYEVVWNGKDLRGHEVPSGIYVYRLQAGQMEVAKRMVLLR